MDMGMESKLLTPGMQHGEEADFRTEVTRVASDFEKCLGTGAEQQIVDDFLVLQSQCRELRRKCEDHMDVARREKFSLPCGDPAFPGRGLTLRAVSIAAAVVGDGGTMPARTRGFSSPTICRTRLSSKTTRSITDRSSEVNDCFERAGLS